MMLSKIDEYIMILCAWKIITSASSICWPFAIHDERNAWVICMDDENKILIKEKCITSHAGVSFILQLDVYPMISCCNYGTNINRGVWQQILMFLKESISFTIHLIYCSTSSSFCLLLKIDLKGLETFQSTLFSLFSQL